MTPTYTLEIYRLDVVNSVFQKIDQIITFQDLSFFHKLNGIGAASFSLNIRDPKANPDTLSRYRSILLIKRNNVAVWVGMISKVSGNYESEYINVEALSYLATLETRYTEQSDQYLNTNANDIYTTLISDVQARTNGTLLIQTGSIAMLDPIDATFEYESIANALMSQSDNENGFDFDFVPILDVNNDLDYIQFNIYTALGSYREDLAPLSIGDNIANVEFATQDNIYNNITGLGQGLGTAQLSSIQEDTDSQEAFTRREFIAKYSNISVQSTLDDKIAELLNERKANRYDIDVELLPDKNITITDISIGDVLNVNIVEENTFINFTGTARIFELNITIDSEGVERITPKIIYYQ